MSTIPSTVISYCRLCAAATAAVLVTCRLWCRVSNGTEEPITAGDANRPLAARDASGHSASSSASSPEAPR